MRVLGLLLCLLVGLFAPPAEAQIARQQLGNHIACNANVLSPCTGLTPWPTKIQVGAVRSVSDFDVTWSQVNTAHGVYDWTDFDKFVAKAQANGADIIYDLFNTPVWASSAPAQSCTYSNGGCAPPSSNTYWTDWVSAFVAHNASLGTPIKYVEVWNEPNFPLTWSGTVAQMVTLTQLAYPILHAAGLTVLGPTTSLYPNDPSLDGGPWTETFFADGGAAYLDIFAVHTYPAFYTSDPVPAEQLLLATNRWSIIAATYGVTLPMWDTEGGWFDQPSLTNTQLQADFTVKHEALALSSGFDRAYWFSYDEYQAQCGSNNSLCFGIQWSGSGGGLTKAGTAFGLLQRWLFNATPVTPVARQANANGITNPTATGASSGTPGTPPTGWSVDAPDVGHGIATSITAGSGYIDFRVHGTATAGASGFTILNFVGANVIACAGAGQQWWQSIGVSLVGGSYSGLGDTASEFDEYSSGGSYLTTSGYRQFTATNLAFGQQNVLYYGSTQNAGCAFVRPKLAFEYSVGSPFDITLRVGSPSIDNGTQFKGSFTLADGSSAILAWDSGSGSSLSPGGSFKTYATDTGAINSIIGGSVPLTGSPVWIQSAAKAFL